MHEQREKMQITFNFSDCSRTFSTCCDDDNFNVYVMECYDWFKFNDKNVCDLSQFDQNTFWDFIEKESNSGIFDYYKPELAKFLAHVDYDNMHHLSPSVIKKMLKSDDETITTFGKVCQERRAKFEAAEQEAEKELAKIMPWLYVH